MSSSKIYFRFSGEDLLEFAANKKVPSTNDS